MNESLPTPDQLSRFLAGTSPPAEEEAVRRWLASRVDRAVDVESALQRVKSRSAGPSPIGIRFVAVAAAAVVVMIAGAITARRSAPPAESITRTTSVGERDSLVLADGSRVILGPSTTVVIARDRDVELRGDAYFNVVHDARRPFTVRSLGTTIRDMGTAFAVSSDSGTPLRVVVSEGVVEVSHRSTAVTLQRGDVGIVEAGQLEALRGVATEDDLAWLEGQLVFRDASMSEVVADLRRWYGVELRMTDSSLLSRRFTGNFAGDPAERVVEVLALALGARADRRGDTVYLAPAPGSTAK